MTYTEAFTVTDPDGSSEISKGDDWIRQFKRAIKERVESVVEDINADPWKLKAAAVVASGALSAEEDGLQLVVPPFAAMPDIYGVDPFVSTKPDVGTGRVYHQGTGQSALFYPIVLPGRVAAGIVTITGYRLRVSKDATDDVFQGRLWMLLADGTQSPQPLLISTATTGEQLLDSGTIVLPVPQGASFYFWATAQKVSGALNPYYGSLTVDYQIVAGA